MSGAGIPQALAAVVRQYANIDRLQGTILEPRGFAATNRASRPFPIGFPESHQGINQATIGQVIINNSLEAYWTPQTHSLIYVQPVTPGHVKQALGLWMDQANRDGNCFQCSAMMYGYLRTESLADNNGPNMNYAENEELRVFFHNFHYEFTQLEEPQIVKAIVLNWARRCCGIINCGLCFGAKIEYAVVDVMMEHCPNTARRQFSNDLTRAYDGIPTKIIHHLAKAASQYIKAEHALPTWFFPNDDDICPSDFQEYIDDHALLHLSDVLVRPNWNDECTWVLDPTNYPLAPGDTNHNQAIDTVGVDPDRFYLKDEEEDSDAVLDAARIWIGYMLEWNADPLAA